MTGASAGLILVIIGAWLAAVILIVLFFMGADERR